MIGKKVGKGASCIWEHKLVKSHVVTLGTWTGLERKF